MILVNLSSLVNFDRKFGQKQWYLKNIYVKTTWGWQRHTWIIIQPYSILMYQDVTKYMIDFDNKWYCMIMTNSPWWHINTYVSLVIFSGVALAVNDFSSGIMSASAGDDNSTKELKGLLFFVWNC